MRKEVLFILLDGFADWEGAILAPALNTGFSPAGIQPTAYIPKTVSPKGRVRSLGGLTVQTDYTFDTLPDRFSALILVGGTGWQSEEAEKFIPVIEKALASNILVAGICNASLFLGAHGFLNNVQHTSNTLPVLKQWGGSCYTGEHLYKEQQAVCDGQIVTANGTGHLEFARACLLWLAAGTPEEIEGWYQFYKQGLYKA